MSTVSNRGNELFFLPNTIYPERIVPGAFTEANLKFVAAGIGNYDHHTVES